MASNYLRNRQLSLYVIILLLLLYTLSLGFIVEVIQTNFNREMDLADLYRNFLGCFLAIIFFQIKKGTKNKVFIAAFIAIFSLIVVEQKALFSALMLKHQQHQKLPILADFSLVNERSLWSEGEVITNTTEHYTLKVKLTAGGKYSGFTFTEVYQDWRGFNVIEFRLRSFSNTAEKLCMKITDLSHDNGGHAYDNRFNHCFALSYGDNVIAIPLSDISLAPKHRKLNLAEISQIGFFMIDLKEDKLLYVDEITLK